MLRIVVLLACVAVSFAVIPLDCSRNTKAYDNPADISISSCDGSVCKLKRRSEIQLELKIKPQENISSLHNKVFARMLGIPFPFIGVDGTSACTSVFNTDGSKATCPLMANQEYVYRNSFKILDIYPKVKMDVHWSLVYGDNTKSLLCFEVPARITS